MHSFAKFREPSDEGRQHWTVSDHSRNRPHMASTPSGQVSTVLKLSTPLLFLSMTCLPTTLSDRPFCFPQGNDRICYTLYWDRGFTWTAAANACRMRHANGRLLTIFDKTTQSRIERLLNGIVYQKPAEGVWLGARLQFLEDWTWVNNDVYEDRKWHQFPDKRNMYNRGYVIARLTRGKEKRYLTMEVVPINDPSRPNYARALCECLRTDLSGCGHTSDKRYGPIAWINRWHEARNGCTNFTQTDLAVLSHDDIGVYEEALTENQPYFIGLRNVRLTWNLSESELEAKYTNWDDNEPATSNRQTDCVYASAGRWKWRTKRCDESSVAFICESVTSTSTTAAAAAGTTSSDTTASVPGDATAVPLPLSSSNNGGSNVLVLLAVLTVVIIAVIIIACVALYFRRKLLQERQRSPDNQTHSSITERHLSVIEEESAYSLINDADVTVVSYGTEDAANVNTPNGAPGYATVKKIPKDRSNGRSDGKALTNNDKPRTTDGSDQPTISLTVADSTGYYSITSAPESHPQTSSEQESGYELLARRAFDNVMYMQSIS